MTLTNHYPSLRDKNVMITGGASGIGGQSIRPARIGRSRVWQRLQFSRWKTISPARSEGVVRKVTAPEG